MISAQAIKPGGWTMIDYDVCRDINNFYFSEFETFSLTFPDFFDEFSEEGLAIRGIRQLIDRKKYEEAAAEAESCLLRFSPETHNAFLTWQIFAYWKQGKIPDAEFVNYFDAIEESFPKEAYINFNKAALYIRDKKFNEAVGELKTARKKDPGHIYALTSLFWIYYLSRDEQWRSLFKTVLDYNILPARITNLISVVRSIQDGIQSPYYNFGSQAGWQAENEALFTKFPPFKIEKPLTRHRILFVAAETKYLHEFVTTFLLSALELKSADFGIHIHLYDPDLSDLGLVKKYDEKYPQLGLSYSSENGTPASAFKNSYYASMRFCRAYELFEKHPGIEKLAVVDADALIRKNPFERGDILESDMVVTAGLEIAPDWDRFAGGFMSFSRKVGSLDAFACLANILLKNFSEKKEFWFIDQVAIFDTVKRFGDKLKIARASFFDLFGEEMKFTDAATFWTYTNEHKMTDNAMNRERKRLIEKYGKL